MFTEDTFGLVSGESPLRHVLDQVEQVAAASGGVLVRGEPGTGRGIVAHAIHARRCTAGAPFVPIDCSALDGGAEDRLFGGTTTGEGRQASSNQRECILPGSALHGAIGGTLYLRNIEELPARVQSRLARLLRDRECRVGTRSQTVPYDVRPIAAVDPDIEAIATDGRLRADLYRRFTVNQVNVPPLRECREEIPGLAEFLLADACRRTGFPVKTIESAASSILAAMPWRGNARELMGVIHTLAIKVSGVAVTLDELLATVRLDAGPQVSWNLGAPLREARQHFEREYIAAVVAQFHGRVPDAARSLGIQRTNLYRKLRSLHIKAELEKKQGGGRMLRA